MTQSVQLPAGAIVVTGACGGIGNELVNMFAEKGREVVAISRPGKEVKLRKNNVSPIHALHADLCDKSSIAGLASRVKLVLQGRPISALVNTAGIVTPLQPLKDFNAEMLMDNFAVNTIAPAILACGLSGEMVDGARVLNFSSRAALLTLPGLSAYCMSKHALRSITRSLQLELPDHIAVGSLIPGEVNTGMQGDLRMPDAEVFPLVQFFRKNVGSLIPAAVAANFIYWVLFCTDSTDFARDDAWYIYDTSHHQQWICQGDSFDYPEP